MIDSRVDQITGCDEIGRFCGKGFELGRRSHLTYLLVGHCYG